MFYRGKYPIRTRSTLTVTSDLPYTQVWDYSDLMDDEGIAVEFRMTYRGPLPSHRNDDKSSAKMVAIKHRIRTALHPQIKDFWMSHPAMRSPASPFVVSYTEKNLSFWDIYAERHKAISEHGHVHKFAPLITEKDYFGCAVNILFLRRDTPNVSLIHKGDLDNRLKVLFDALRMPGCTNEVFDEPQLPEQTPCFCLLKDDKYIDHVSVTTDRLLAPALADEKEDDVLIILHIVARVIESERNFSPL
jgi:hypothetical protein